MASNHPTLSLPRELINKLLTHAQKNPDIEVCGLIGNDASQHKDYYPIKNVAKNPNCRFLMDAPQQISAMKEMRDKNQTLFGIVHSHPTADAMPSQRDIEHNDYRDVYYFIISLNTRGVLEIRCFILQGNDMQEIDLELET